MKDLRLIAVVWKEEEGYVSMCPELGVPSRGDSPDEALENLGPRDNPFRKLNNPAFAANN